MDDSNRIGSDAAGNLDRKESNQNAVSVMDLLLTLASTVFSSTVNMLRENTVIQSISKRLSRRTMSFPEMYWPVPMRAIGAQNLLTMPGGVSTSGYLHKKGGSQFSLMKWPLRYIIIHKGCVYYFKSSTSPSPQGAFSLNGYNRVMRAAEETTSSNVFPFKIVHFSKKHRTWYFSAASEDERRKWMRHLRREIDHYNDRKEAQISSDSDSDADFYGTIERPMEIKHAVDTAEDDYVDEDDDEEDEEDYLKPDGDGSPTTTGRPTGPPPAYPPPPVPATSLRRESSPNIQKPTPPPVPGQHRNPTSPLPKKPSLSHQPLQKEQSKGPPPPLPFAPHLQKSPSPSPTPPALPPSSLKTAQNRTISLGNTANDRRDLRSHSTVQVHSPATLPICDQLHNRMVLNGPVNSSPNTGSTQSLGNPCLRPKPSMPQPHTEVNLLSISAPSLPAKPPSSPLLKSGLHNKLSIPKPPPPTPKPPQLLEKPKSPFQRASPDGQSFRSLGEEIPADNRKKAKSSKHRRDSDDDYENVQLPDSVFIDSTETTFVEKLFKECCANPPDGLYGIRNSGTKTAKVLVVWDVAINKARNYRLFEEDDSVFLESDLTFPHLAALVEHYYSHPLPHHGSLCLQKPYAKVLTF
ncbi:SH3 domain-binding protein 2 isoform X1 [Gambusia affinis]|uniref:SH3 domain-binding protein 2 isoform X1 n=2 Tax=Gambusia affinis TaxID=33528 RepID=UPI001CDCD0C8|nr:SH3 domain-binding protein 2 isoform X1 [Gambusia affinis]